MKISIINEKDNPLLKRRELYVNIEHDDSATPSKAGLQTFLSKEFKKNVEQVDIRNIFSDSGISSSKARVFLWEEKSVADLSKTAKEKKEEKPKEEKPEKEEAKPEEKKEESKKEEKPKEEDKEEKPKEETKEKPKAEPKEEKKGEKKEESKEAK